MTKMMLPQKEPTTQKGAADPFPVKVRPMLAVPVEKAFDDKDWAFEIKWDGIRCIYLRNKREGIMELQARSGVSIKHRYPEIIGVADSVVQCESVVLDGELVVLGDNGLPDFQRHQSRMNVDSPKDIQNLSVTSPATYYVFDILYLDGKDVEPLEFIERRKILKNVIAKDSDLIRISGIVEEYGKQLFEKARNEGLEGIIAKHKRGRYLQSTRSDQWLKMKGVWTQDCVVIGYTPGEGNREGFFGSLILAAYYDNKLKFIGHSGSGFRFADLKEIYHELRSLKIGHCPVDYIPYVNRPPVWIRPELVVEVKFSGWTRDRIMRSPIFLRMRDDKLPQECITEVPKDIQKTVSSAERKNYSAAAFTNLNKVFWPAVSGRNQITKGDLIHYYEKVNDYILPHLRDRPLSLKRYPSGITGGSFFQKNWDAGTPDFVQTIQVFSESRNAVIRYLICNNKETLLWLANLGCIELHPWYSRVHNYRECIAEATGERILDNQSLDEDLCGLGIPDFIVFDLDPYIYSGRESRDEEPHYNVKGFKSAVEVALSLKDLLDDLKIKSFVKTSGKTGLHVFVPINADYSFDQTRAFAAVIGKILEKRTPDKITMDWNVSRRKGKVFFDYKQNVRGKTLASILSVRPTGPATVSMPLNWKTLPEVLPTDFRIENVPDMLKKSGNPWQNILQEKQDIAKLVEKVSSL